MEKRVEDEKQFKKKIDHILEKAVWGCSEYGEMRCNHCVYNVGAERIVCVSQERRCILKN